MYGRRLCDVRRSDLIRVHALRGRWVSGKKLMKIDSRLRVQARYMNGEYLFFFRICFDKNTEINTYKLILLL